MAGHRQGAPDDRGAPGRHRPRRAARRSSWRTASCGRCASRASAAALRAGRGAGPAGRGRPAGAPRAPAVTFLAPLDPFVWDRDLLRSAVRLRLRLGGLRPGAQAALGLLRAAHPVRRSAGGPLRASHRPRQPARCASSACGGRRGSTRGPPTASCPPCARRSPRTSRSVRHAPSTGRRTWVRRGGCSGCARGAETWVRALPGARFRCRDGPARRYTMSRRSMLSTMALAAVLVLSLPGLAAADVACQPLRLIRQALPDRQRRVLGRPVHLQRRAGPGVDACHCADGVRPQPDGSHGTSNGSAGGWSSSTATAAHGAPSRRATR